MEAGADYTDENGDMETNYIDIYANDEGTTQVLKSIEFNFPIYKDGTFVRKILLDERVNVETLVCLERK